MYLNILLTEKNPQIKELSHIVLPKSLNPVHGYYSTKHHSQGTSQTSFQDCRGRRGHAPDETFGPGPGGASAPGETFGPGPGGAIAPSPKSGPGPGGAIAPGIFFGPDPGGSMARSWASAFLASEWLTKLSKEKRIKNKCKIE